jgi:hypothetical protein
MECLEIAMNVEHISTATTLPDARAAGEAAEQTVINLQEIKSILYLGVKGKIHLPAAESHRVDTFA